MSRTSLPAFVSPLPLRHTSHGLRTPRTSTCTTTASLSDVLIVAANRGLGHHLTTLIHPTTTNLHTTHRPRTKPSHTQVTHSTTHELNALDEQAAHDVVTAVMPKTMISCIGGDPSNGEALPDYDANKNLIDAARKAGVKHFVLISMLGAGNSEAAVPFQVMDTLRPILLEKSHAEAYLREMSDMKWTIIRPAPIIESSEDAEGMPVATEGLTCYGTITRPDLASMVSKIVESSNATGKTLHVVDRKGILVTSPYVRPLEFWEPLPFEEFTL